MIKDYIVREERPEEFPAIHNLVETAFETARVKDGTEQDFVDRLRASGGYIPELALVAAGDAVLLGHIMLTRLVFKADSGVAPRALLLAPLSVLMEYRGQGIGAALVAEALRRARESGFQAVFLAGDPGYYGRFGFVRSDSLGVRCGESIPPQFLLALELEEGGLTAGEVDMSVEREIP